MNSPPRRTVITGMGMVTPIGIGIDRFREGLHAARSAVRRIECFDASSYSSQMAAEVRGFDPSDFMGPKQVRRLERFSQFSVAAARMAVVDAGLDLSLEDGNRLGVSMGSALGGVGMAETECLAFFRKGLRDVNPMLALSVYGGSGGCNISIEMGACGPNFANSNSCASGTIAVGSAMHAIRLDQADVMLAGGAEAPLYPLCYGAFAVIRAMSMRNDEPEKACRPFDAQRDGFVMGEGSALLVLEEMEHALRRNARIYGEIAGYACTNDAHHMTAPLPDGSQAARAMSLALADAGVSPQDVEYINAHGSSTPLNDKAETLAIKSVFGELAYRIPISGTKAMHGHSLGAAGAIEACACALALSEGFLPPTVNLENPDPECDLDYIPQIERDQAVSCILSNSFGFGGINAALVLKRL